MHPVVSVITLTATGLLCYAGHVCNYHVKVLEWFQELPATLRNKNWFLIKRRRNIGATAGETAQNKPPTGNRRRLEAAIAEARRYMPRVYAGSVENAAELSKYPTDGEQEMFEVEESVDLEGDVKVNLDMWAEWMETDSCQCAAAVMRYATDQQGADMRGA